MKKYLMALFLMAFVVGNAEMVWVGFDPNVKGTSTSGAISTGFTTHPMVEDLLYGQTISLQVLDTAASNDTTYAVFYSRLINTQDVIAATGIVQLMAVVDTTSSGDLGSILGSDSLSVLYTIKTSNIAYDASAAFTLVAQTQLTAVTATARMLPITLGGDGGEFMDTLFKAWTWFEIQIQDSTAWMDTVSQDFIIYGSGLDDAVLTGNSTAGKHDYYKYWIFDPGSDDDSIVWGHYNYDGDSMSTLLDTIDITASNQTLDSGIIINFNAGTGHTDGDTFMFLASDSLHYGQATDFRIRMGLNLHRR